MSPLGRRRWRVRVLRGGICAVALYAVGCVVWPLVHPELIDAAAFAQPRASMTLSDRHGEPLRYTRHDGINQRWTQLAHMSPAVLQAFVAVEDGRFYEHRGVDYLATLRAVASLVLPDMQTSGASTITQQTVKLVYGRRAGLRSKPLEVLRALALEEELSKREILEQYLNRVPFGDQIVGVGQASRAYFGKPPSELSVGEAALLAGIPQAPSVTEPRRHLPRALRRRRLVLSRMLLLGFIDQETHDDAVHHTPVVASQTPRPWRAPRFADRLMADYLRGSLEGEAMVQAGELRGSLELDLQSRVEAAVAEAVDRFEAQGVRNGAAVVLHNATGEVLAYVGAARRGPDVPGGSLDLLQARRQPGSTLKPFVFELLFEDGATAATVLDDISRPMTGADGALFEAEDYDGRQRGPVRARVALAASLNLTAVDAAQRVGAGRVVERLRELGIRGLAGPERYGAAIALGGPDIAPIDLARAYLVLARGGRNAALRFTPAGQQGGDDLMEAGAAALTRHILTDAVTRRRAFGRDLLDVSDQVPFALKTGTSSGWHDAWAAAFTDDVTIVVWLGDPGGQALRAVSGFDAAAPLAARLVAVATPFGAARTAELVAATDREPSPDSGRPELSRSYVCALSGALPGGDCPHTVLEHFVAGTVPTDRCEFHLPGGRTELPARFGTWLEDHSIDGAVHVQASAPAHETLRVAHPADGARLLVDGSASPRIRLRAARGERRVVDVAWRVDGRLLEGETLTLSPGEHTVVAHAGGEMSAPVHIHVFGL